MPVQVRLSPLKYKTIQFMHKVARLDMMPDYELYWASAIMRLGSLIVCPEPRQRLVL